MSEYPEMITEMIKMTESGKLQYFNLSEFMSGPPLDEVFAKIDRTMEFFSVYVDMEHLAEKLWEDERFEVKEEARLCSRLEEEARRYWWDRNTEHLELIDERMEKLKNHPEFSHMKERDLRDKVIKDLNHEVYPEMIEFLKEEYQEIYKDEWEEYWKKEDPFKPRTEIRYHRRYDMPPPFDNWDTRNPWQQYYFAKNKKGAFYYAQGGSGSSGQRYNHGFYGHLFALLNSKNPVPTYFFTYDSHNHFIFNRKEKCLCLNFFDLIGNFHIDGKESQRILQDVGRIEGSGTLL
jgi:hypothetical protein